MSVAERIKEKAVELGFDVVGIGPAGIAPHQVSFLKWLDEGHQGNMQWLAQNPERRSDPQEVVSGARSVITVGMSYYTESPPKALWNDPFRGRIARYAWGIDYHNVMEPMLRSLTDFVRDEAGREINARYYVDTGPVLERESAWQAGVGFIGKHSLAISPQYASYIFLGEIILDLELDHDEPASSDGLELPVSRRDSRVASCGTCRRCLDVCPTHAFPAPYVLNSRRCISYLTIELKESIPVEMRTKMKNWIYGCDECQEICPWVKRYAKPGRGQFLSLDCDRFIPDLAELITINDEEFRKRYRETPIKRTKRRGLLRNAAVALGNAGKKEALPALEKAARDEEPLIREHAEWAMRAIESGGQ